MAADGEPLQCAESVVEAGTEEVAVQFKALRRKGIATSVTLFFPSWETTYFVCDVEGDIVSVRFTDPPGEDATLRWALLQT